MKKHTFITLILLSSCIGYLAGTGSQLSAQSHIGGDADKVATEAQYLVMRKEAIVENSITAANDNWRIDEDGVAYFNQIVLEPQELNDLLPVDGALIFLTNPVQIGMGYGDAWHYAELIPEEEWTDGMVCDAAVYYGGRRWIARTDNLVIQ
jgi:hypothetical protein